MREALRDADQQRPKVPPIERRAGVGLATRSDVGVPDDVDDRIAPAQRRSELSEAQVLLIGVGLVVAALELDSHGKIVAALAPLPARRAGVPGALRAGNELDQLA